MRRTAGNHLGDSRDLDNVIERRIDQFRDALLDKVARVIQSPASSNVFILSKDPQDKENKRFVIEDSPESIPIKGLSLTVSPEGPEQEIAAWAALSRGSSESSPPSVVIWKWYGDRCKINISEEHCLFVFQFSLWRQVPVFYWIKDLGADAIRKKLIECVKGRPNNAAAEQMLIVASFLGKSTYSTVLSALGNYKNFLSPRMRKFPQPGPRIAFRLQENTGAKKQAVFRKEKLDELNKILSSSKETDGEPILRKRWRAIDLDRFIYAQDDKYK